MVYFNCIGMFVHCYSSDSILKSKGTCRRVAGALKFHSVPDASSGSVVRKNINTSHESLALAPEKVTLRELLTSGNNNAESDTRTSRRLRSTCSCF
jgi:hypothetical protein